jgi:transposase
MIQVHIPTADMNVLQEERYIHPHPRVQRKLHGLYWVGLGYPRHDVARVVGVSEGTVRNYIHTDKSGGLEALRQFNPHPPSAALNAYTDTIRQAFIEQPPHTVQEAVNRIKELTGIRRSPPAVRTWLKKRSCPVKWCKSFGFLKSVKPMASGSLTTLPARSRRPGVSPWTFR